MSEAGLSAEDQAVLRSGNPGAINARLSSGPGATAGGPMMLVVDVAGDQVNVRPLLQFPQQIPPLVQQIQQIPPLVQQIQPSLVFPVHPPPVQPPPVGPPPVWPPPVWPPPVWPPPPPQIQWPIHPPIWPPPPPPQIHWPIHPPPIWPPPPPPVHFLSTPPPQLVFQQIHPMLVAPGPLG